MVSFAAMVPYTFSLFLTPLRDSFGWKIAAISSAQNNCHYCQSIHESIASAHLGGDEHVVERVKQDFESAAVSPRLKALLAIAGKVRQDGKNVTPEDVQRARNEGATDLEIHDTVLIAAAFCMYNRYVDGLATVQPRDPDLYRQRGKMVARDGYVAANLQNAAEPSTAAWLVAEPAAELAGKR